MVHLFIIPHWLHHAAELVLMAAAFWRGAWRSRLLASAMFTVGMAQHVIYALAQSYSPYTPTHLVGSSLDLANLAACLICLRTADRYWVICVASLNLIAAATQVLWLLDPHLSAWAVGSADVIWTYLLIAAIAWGVVAEPREEPWVRAGVTLLERTGPPAPASN